MYENSEKKDLLQRMNLPSYQDLTDSGATVVPFFLNNGDHEFDIHEFYSVGA